MSTTVQARDELKQQSDVRSHKDDIKQQESLKKQESKEQSPRDADDDGESNSPIEPSSRGQGKDVVEVDEGSSLVGGVMGAVAHAVDSGINMLPEGLATRAHDLEDKLKLAATPVMASYNDGGLMAAAKSVATLGVSAAQDLTSQAKDAASGAATGITNKASDIKTGLQTKASDITSGISTNIQKKASNLQAKASSAAASISSTASNLKSKLPLVGGGAPAEPKKHHRRRRGGRGHGNRKHKLKEVPVHEPETVLDTLGEKAAEIKDVVVEEVKPAAAASTGVLGSIRSGASGLVESATSKVSNVTSSIQDSINSGVQGVKSTASGMVEKAQDTISSGVSGVKSTASGLVDKAQDTLASIKGTTQDKKPTLERQDAIPALGTPMTPAEGDVVKAPGEPMRVNPGTDGAHASGGVLATAAFYGQKLKDAVIDKFDNMSLNADDDTPMSSEDKRSTLSKATAELNDLKEKAGQKIEEVKEDLTSKKDGK